MAYKKTIFFLFARKAFNISPNIQSVGLKVLHLFDGVNNSLPYHVVRQFL